MCVRETSVWWRIPALGRAGFRPSVVGSANTGAAQSLPPAKRIRVAPQGQKVHSMYAQLFASEKGSKLFDMTRLPRDGRSSVRNLRGSRRTQFQRLSGYSGTPCPLIR